MEYTLCPTCESSQCEVVFSRGNLDKELINVLCGSCGLVFINPRPSYAQYHEFHKEEFLTQKNLVSTADLIEKITTREIPLKQTIVNFCAQYISKEKIVLDVGCGFGTSLYLINKQFGSAVFGVELGKLDVAAAKEFYQLELFEGSLEEFADISDNAHKFDVIIMHHVFEHLPDPLRALSQSKQLLKHDGILYIAVPNVMNIKKRPDILFQIAHPFTYSPASLKRLVEKAGFGIVKFNRNAGYPGGFECVLKYGEKSIADRGLEEGLHSDEVRTYIHARDEKFALMRNARDRYLWFIPQKLRIRISNTISNFLKHHT